uniref:RING-type E3 ubiquitin transferase n=1 Tax=Globodera rostochiensis TaxID=31243 RepID=A0A914HHT7_GLORO
MEFVLQYCLFNNAPNSTNFWLEKIQWLQSRAHNLWMRRDKMNDQETSTSSSFIEPIIAPVQRKEKTLKDRIMESIMFAHEEEDGQGEKDICRVCRLSGSDTLYHPCLCTGSIKYVHQDCLLQWLKYSKKDVCELCNHKFSFQPLYRPDMPDRLPIWDLLKGVFLILANFMRLTLTYAIVVCCWLGIVPLMAARIHRLVFSGLISAFFSSRIFQLFSTENVAIDIAKGSLVVTIFLCTFISLVWLREQIMIGGPAHILHLNEEQPTTEGQQQQIQQRNREGPNPGASTEHRDQSQERAEQMANGPSTSEAENDPNQLPQSRQPRPLHVYQPVQATALAANHNQPAEGQQPQNGGEAAAAAEIDPQHQRFVDELTWQKLLGLDGSFAFIEHVFWTISLNVVFNVVFLYFPAQIGSGILSTIGFVAILMHGLVIHRIAKIFRLRSLYTAAGMFCLMLKVFLLVIVEVVFFPILCGWWLDVCSLPLTGITLEERIRTFKQYPSSSMFLHWLAGMVYVFYSASFILILRELLRPGVLWFIRNLNDPDFNPIQEMIEQPVPRHFRRLVTSITLFFSIILLVIYVPLRMIKWLFPATLPYVFSGSADTPLVEYSFELVLLQIIMPSILEYSKAFSLLKRAVRFWCRVVGGWLLLDSYLLPADKDKRNVGQQRRDQQRQRARERMLRGDQGEQIGLLEALEAIEDNSTDDEALENDNNGENVEGLAEDVGNETGSEQDENEGVEEDEPEKLEEEAVDNEVEDAEWANENGGKTNTPTEVLEDLKQQKGRLKRRRSGEGSAEQNTDNALEENNPNERVLVREVQRRDRQHVRRAQAQHHREQRNLGAQHQALLRFRDASVPEDYVQPNFFPLRVTLLLVFVALTAVVISLIFFLLPVTIGRFLLSILALTNQPVHDLYTIAVGLYTCWICVRLGLLSREWARRGWVYMKKLFNATIFLLVRVIAAAFPLLTVIPLMLGLYFQMLVISPLRVAIFQSPLFFPWKEWAMGVVHFKIVCASVLMGPDWWLKTAFEQVYADGIWNIRLWDLYVNLVFPIVNTLAFLIAFPYALSNFVLVFVDASREEQVIATRFAYPILLGSICFCAFLIWQWQKLKLLAQKIRNDKYLIGTQLVNFYRENTSAVVGFTTAKISLTPPTQTPDPQQQQQKTPDVAKEGLPNTEGTEV